MSVLSHVLAYALRSKNLIEIFIRVVLEKFALVGIPPTK